MHCLISTENSCRKRGNCAALKKYENEISNVLKYLIYDSFFMILRSYLLIFTEGMSKRLWYL